MEVTVVDAGVVIAILDSSDAHHAVARQAVAHAMDRGDRLVIPASAYAEVLVAPYGRGAEAVATVEAFLAASPSLSSRPPGKSPPRPPSCGPAAAAGSRFLMRSWWPPPLPSPRDACSPPMPAGRVGQSASRASVRSLADRSGRVSRGLRSPPGRRRCSPTARPARRRHRRGRGQARRGPGSRSGCAPRGGSLLGWRS